MSRRSPIALWLMLPLVAGCSSAADRQLESVKSARSVLAEWAMVAALRERDQVSATYAEETASTAREQLASLAATLPPGLGALPEAPSPAMLRARAGQAAAIESRLEAR